MVHALDTGSGSIERRPIAQISLDQLDTRLLEVARAPGVADQRPYAVSRLGKPSCQMSAGKAGRAGDEVNARSAYSVTGDPKSRSSPARASQRSDVCVKPAEPIALCSAIGSTNCRWTALTRKPCCSISWRT